MIKNIEYKENGSIDLDIDNTELLRGRADIDVNESNAGERIGDEIKAKEFEGHRAGLGGMEGGEEEIKLKTDLKRTGWKEAKKATDVKHTCPVCGTRYWGRPNKDYCGTPCKEVAKKRRQRKRKRDIRDFKPHSGTAGEVYIMCDVKGKNVISFIPALYCDTRAKAKEYIESIYPEDKRDDYIQQVNEVLRK